MFKRKFKKRIVIVTHRMDNSGAPTSLLNLICEIKLRNVTNINTIAMRGGSKLNRFRDLSDGLYVVSEKNNTNLFESFILFFRFCFIVFFKSDRSDVFLINSSANLRAMLACKLLHKDCYVYVRESERMHDTRLGFLRKKMLGYMSGVICVSYATKKWVEKYVDETRLVVVHNGIHIEHEHTIITSQKQCKNRKCVGVIGYLDKRKGIDYFYQVLNRIVSEFDSVDFMIIGDILDADYKEKLYEFCRLNPDRLKVTGIVDDVYNYINKCDVIVMLSREEALPRAVLESSINSVPVVAFDVAGTKEMLPVNYPFIVENGNLDKFTDKLIELLFCDSKSYGENNYNFIVAHFKQNVLIDKLLSFIGISEINVV